jgi:hypothetical protein
LVVLVAAVLAAELVARILEPILPPPDRWPTDETQAKFDQMATLAALPDPIDVVFLGSSIVVEGIDPLTFNEEEGDLTSYNAALSAASVRSLEPWTLEVVLPLLDPRFLVIGLTTRDVNDGGLGQREFYERITASEGLRDLESDSLIQRVLTRIQESSALLRLRPLLRKPGTAILALLGRQENDGSPLPGPFGSEPLEEQGSEYDASADWRRFWSTRQINDYDIGGVELAALERLVASAESQGREVVLVEMPIHPDYLAVQPGGEPAVAQLHEVLMELALRNDAELLQFHGEFGPEDFRDPAHLNPQAATQLASMLARELTNLMMQQEAAGAPARS